MKDYSCCIVSIKQKEFHHVLGCFFSFLNSNAYNNAMLQAILLLNPPKLDLNQTMKITQWDIKNFSCKMIKMISFLSCKYFYILIYMP